MSVCMHGRKLECERWETVKVKSFTTLQDCHAMGAQAKTALALAVVPFGLDSKMEEELFQMLAGALPVLQAAGCALVGGHTCEGSEASLGMSVCLSMSPCSLQSM